MRHPRSVHHVQTVIIGGGQAGLALGYYLAQHRHAFVILDAGARVGDAWRCRWDSLRLFSPAAASHLPGLPFPAPANSFPTKDAVADYLETYARVFDLPVRLGQRTIAVRCADGSYQVITADAHYTADQVVVATGPYHAPRVPSFASHLDPAIRQLHSSAYRTPDQLPDGGVLVVGAGNSGAEIALDLAATRHVVLSGRDTGYVPAGLVRRRLFWWLLNQITVDPSTRFGHKVLVHQRRRGDPLFRLTPAQLQRAGVARVPRTAAVRDGKPQLADNRVLDVASVVWATGFQPNFGWIDLPIFAADGYPLHRHGVVAAAPGLFFLGLPFQRTLTSAALGGVGKDAHYLSKRIITRH